MMSDYAEESDIQSTSRLLDVRLCGRIGHPEHVEVAGCPIMRKNQTSRARCGCWMSDNAEESDIQSTLRLLDVRYRRGIGQPEHKSSSSCPIMWQNRTTRRLFQKKRKALSHPETEPSFSIHYLAVMFIFFKIAESGNEMAIPTAFWTRLPGIEASGVMALPYRIHSHR